MNRVLGLIFKHLKRIAEPNGKEGNFDKLSLSLWEVYAILMRILVFFREKEIGKIFLLPGKEKLHIRVQHNSNFYRNHLTENLLQFWENHSVDHKYGGFISHLDKMGQTYDDNNKTSMMQARMIYAFSVGYELQPNLKFTEVAKQGVNFLTENLWDHEFGGWYGSAYRDGKVRETRKELWAQAFVLIGLVEYYRLTRDDSIFTYIKVTYDLLEQYAWDKRYLGYYEICHRDWSIKSRKKTICVQLDLLEAVMSLYYATGEKRYLNRLNEIADLVVTRMCDRKYGCVLEVFYEDWLYNPIATRDQVQFGHNLKAARLLLEMFMLTKDQKYYSYAGGIIDYCINYGWDISNHGFYQYAYRNGILASSEKLWWPECEGISTLLLMYNLTNDSLYYEYFKKLADFSITYFVDHSYGEWFTSCHADGTVKNEKKGGDHNKAAFHTTQACFYAYRYLEAKNKLIRKKAER